MKNNYYKDQNKRNYKFILIVLFVLVFILLCLVTAVIKIKSNEKNKSIDINSDSLTTVKEVIEYYGSEYISEELSKKDNFYKDYYLVLKYLPYNDDDTSNKKYYDDLLNTSARVIGYRNFSMIDNKNNINIDVICSNGKISKIIINDIEDYFNYMDSQISLKNYEEIPITEFSINSPIINDCILNKWSPDIYIGQRDSIFDEYNIYLDEGVNVRVINNSIYNIVFTKKYQENVVNNIFVGVDLKTIETNLGKPSFETEDGNLIGYKGNNIYVFFTEEEISIYRNLDIDIDEFWKLTDQFIAKDIDLLEFMNQLTYLWPDYSSYIYTSNSVFLAYPSKGIEIKLNYDDISGILVYNNIKSSLTRVSRYLEDTNFISRLKIDSVFEAEKRRVDNENNYLIRCKEYYESLDDEVKKTIGESLRYNIYAEKDKRNIIYSIKFISKDENYPNRELNDKIDYFLWLDGVHFIYSKSEKGIYCYNLETGFVDRITSGKEEYVLKGIENNVLKYDDTEILLEY